MTDSPTQADRSPNRLITEASPYLRQHAKNPVDWYPWGKEALSQARAEDKPILLSIGYSACHWCHVMAHECFENVEIAGLMNRDFINVKVDREERLDLDDLYQKSAQVFLGRGGEIVELTNHHGRSVRCSLWTSDVRVKNNEKWLSWSDRRGMPGPRQEFENECAQEERAKRDWDQWLTAMPKAIVPVWSFSLGKMSLADIYMDITPLRAALEREVPNETSRILALLRWFGSGAGPWSGFPHYESAAEDLLLGYPTAKIVEAIQSTSLGPAQAEGAARLFGGWEFQEQRPGGLEEVPETLKKVLWNHVKDTKDTDKLSRAARAFAE